MGTLNTNENTNGAKTLGFTETFCFQISHMFATKPETESFYTPAWLRTKHPFLSFFRPWRPCLENHVSSTLCQHFGQQFFNSFLYGVRRWSARSVFVIKVPCRDPGQHAGFCLPFLIHWNSKRIEHTHFRKSGIRFAGPCSPGAPPLAFQ